MEGKDQVGLSVNRIWEFAEKAIKKPIDPKELEVYEVLDTRARLIIVDGVKDALIPHLSRKNIAHEMWMALQNLFQNKNKNRVLVLEDKLKSTKMIKGESMTLYLMRWSRDKDEFVTIGVTISNGDMVRIALKGFTEEWKPFIKGIVAREKLQTGIGCGTTSFRKSCETRIFIQRRSLTMMTRHLQRD